MGLSERYSAIFGGDWKLLCQTSDVMSPALGPVAGVLGLGQIASGTVDSLLGLGQIASGTVDSLLGLGQIARWTLGSLLYWDLVR